MGKGAFTLEPFRLAERRKLKDDKISFSSLTVHTTKKKRMGKRMTKKNDSRQIGIANAPGGRICPEMHFESI